MKLQPKLKVRMILKSKWDIETKNDFEKEPYILNGYVVIWNGFDFEANMIFWYQLWIDLKCKRANGVIIRSY